MRPLAAAALLCLSDSVVFQELISVKQALTRARTALEGASSKFDPAVPVAQHSEEQKLISLRLEIVAMCLPKPGEFGDTCPVCKDYLCASQCWMCVLIIDCLYSISIIFSKALTFDMHK